MKELRSRSRPTIPTRDRAGAASSSCVTRLLARSLARTTITTATHTHCSGKRGGRGEGGGQEGGNQDHPTPSSPSKSPSSGTIFPSDAFSSQDDEEEEIPHLALPPSTFVFPLPPFAVLLLHYNIASTIHPSIHPSIHQSIPLF